MARLRFVVLLAVLSLALAPVVLAVNSAFFVDVTNPPYNDETVRAIDAMKTAGITVGCNPPANTQYCPEGLVSRWQMALFLTRALGLTGTPAPNTYVSKAKTLDATGAAAGTVLTANGSGSASFQPLPAGGTGTAWSLTGNAGTTPGTNFLGTTDAQPLVVKTNNLEALRVLTDGNVGIGTTTPTARVDVTAPPSGSVGTALKSAHNTGIAVQATSDTGIAVQASSNLVAVGGSSISGTGLSGFSAEGIGIRGRSGKKAVVGTVTVNNPTACVPLLDTSFGVQPFGVGGCTDASGGAGVSGLATNGGFGVQGFGQANGAGVRAESDTGIGVEAATSGSAGIAVLGTAPTRALLGQLGNQQCDGVYGVGGCGGATGDGVVGRSSVPAQSFTAAAFHGFNDAGGDIFIGESVLNGALGKRARIDGAGRGYFNGGYQSGGADYADSMPTTDAADQLEPGDVLALDPEQGYAVRLSREPTSRLVAGVYSTRPSVLGVGEHGIDDSLAGEVPVALVGVVPTKVSAENGPIRIGDLLVTASRPGHAMRAQPEMVNGVPVYPTGAILGKALESLAEGTGTIRVLVMLR